MIKGSLEMTSTAHMDHQLQEREFLLEWLALFPQGRKVTPCSPSPGSL